MEASIDAGTPGVRQAVGNIGSVVDIIGIDREAALLYDILLASKFKLPPTPTDDTAHEDRPTGNWKKAIEWDIRASADKLFSERLRQEFLSDAAPLHRYAQTIIRQAHSQIAVGLIYRKKRKITAKPEDLKRTDTGREVRLSYPEGSEVELTYQQACDHLSEIDGLLSSIEDELDRLAASTPLGKTAQEEQNERIAAQNLEKVELQRMRERLLKGAKYSLNEVMTAEEYAAAWRRLEQARLRREETAENAAFAQKKRDERLDILFGFTPNSTHFARPTGQLDSSVEAEYAALKAVTKQDIDVWATDVERIADVLDQKIIFLKQQLDALQNGHAAYFAKTLLGYRGSLPLDQVLQNLLDEYVGIQASQTGETDGIRERAHDVARGMLSKQNLTNIISCFKSLIQQNKDRLDTLIEQKIEAYLAGGDAAALSSLQQQIDDARQNLSELQATLERLEHIKREGFGHSIMGTKITNIKRELIQLRAQRAKIYDHDERNRVAYPESSVLRAQDPEAKRDQDPNPSDALIVLTDQLLRCQHSLSVLYAAYDHLIQFATAPDLDALSQQLTKNQNELAASRMVYETICIDQAKAAASLASAFERAKHPSMNPLWSHHDDQVKIHQKALQQATEARAQAEAQIQQLETQIVAAQKALAAAEIETAALKEQPGYCSRKEADEKSKAIRAQELNLEREEKMLRFEIVMQKLKEYDPECYARTLAQIHEALEKSPPESAGDIAKKLLEKPHTTRTTKRVSGSKHEQEGEGIRVPGGLLGELEDPTLRLELDYHFTAGLKLALKPTEASFRQECKEVHDRLTALRAEATGKVGKALDAVSEARHELQVSLDDLCLHLGQRDLYTVTTLREKADYLRAASGAIYRQRVIEPQAGPLVIPEASSAAKAKLPGRGWSRLSSLWDWAMSALGSLGRFLTRQSETVRRVDAVIAATKASTLPFAVQLCADTPAPAPAPTAVPA